MAVAVITRLRKLPEGPSGRRDRIGKRERLGGFGAGALAAVERAEVGDEVEGAARSMPCPALVVGLEHGTRRRRRPEEVEAPSPVGHREHESTPRGERLLALLHEAEQVGRMLDHVRGHDDVEPAASHEVRERLTPPDVVHVFDSRDVDPEVRRVLCAELVGVGVVDRLDAKAVPLRQDRVVARADLEAQARGVEEAADLGLTAGRIGELIHGPERSPSGRDAPSVSGPW